METWRVALERVEHGRDARPMALYGLRGVGKTVLLSSFASSARERDWIVSKTEGSGGTSLRRSLGESLHAPLARLARPSAGRRLLQALRTALSFKASYDSSGSWNFGLGVGDGSPAAAGTGVLDTDLTTLVHDLCEAATEEGVGVALLVDEVQDLSREELAALCLLAHTAGQEGWRLVVALAGLPSIPRVLTEAKSYAERLFEYRHVEALSDDQSREALLAPARGEGVGWDEDAVEHVVAATDGYPYFLQQFGQEAWNVAAGPTTIDLADARVGTATGLAALDAGFFRSRWERATRAEQQYLRSMAEDGDAGSATAAVASRVGRSARSVGPARAALITKGLVYPREHGVVAFTVPGMAGFIQRQP